MKTRICISILLLGFATQVFAAGAKSRPPNAKNVLKTKTFASTVTRGPFHVVVRNDGLVEKLPIIVEIRAACGLAEKNWRRLSVKAVQVACDVKVDSIKYDKKKAQVTVEAAGIDWEDFHKRSEGNGPAVMPECSNKHELLTFSLVPICG